MAEEPLNIREPHVDNPEEETNTQLIDISQLREVVGRHLTSDYALTLRFSNAGEAEDADETESLVRFIILEGQAGERVTVRATTGGFFRATKKPSQTRAEGIHYTTNSVDIRAVDLNRKLIGGIRFGGPIFGFGTVVNEFTPEGGSSVLDIERDHEQWGFEGMTQERLDEMMQNAYSHPLNFSNPADQSYNLFLSQYRLTESILKHGQVNVPLMQQAAKEMIKKNGGEEIPRESSNQLVALNNVMQAFLINSPASLQVNPSR